MKILYFLLFFFLPGGLSAQEMYWGRPAKLITSFHFKQLSGGVILVKAQFNSLPDTLNFILDTGSGGISLDSTTVENYHIPHVPSGKYIYGIAGVRKVDYAPGNSLSFPGITIDSLDFYINNYDVLTSVYGTKIDGIIGYSFLSRYIVKVNFDSLKISVFHPGSIRYPQHGYLLRPQLRGIPVIPLVMKDARTIRSRYYFDTGAGLCFLITRQFKEDSALLKKKRKPLPIEVQGLGGRKRMKLTLVQELQIGPYKFKKVPTYILDDEYNIFSYPQLGGLIGNDLLRRFNLIINYPQREIHLSPNGHFRDLFDYSYTGMTMYTLEGQVYIDDIVDGSPADKSGLKNGDIVISINNNFSGNVEIYKNLLQKTGYRIEILVMRNKVPVMINLKVGKIK